MLVACVVLMLGAACCTISNGPSVGETHTISKSVTLGQQKSVVVDIKMGAGKLRVGGGTSDLMNADFTYNVDDWKPEVRYDANGDQGHLVIQQPSGSRNYRGGKRYGIEDRTFDPRLKLLLQVHDTIGDLLDRADGLPDDHDLVVDTFRDAAHS